MKTRASVFVLAVLAAIAYLQRPSTSSPQTESYAVDSVHSVVLFRIKHLNVSAFYGRFNGVKGAFAVNEEGAGAVDITIDAESVDTANEQRDGHLKSPDFFNVKQFPEITFKSDRLTRIGDNRYEAKGTLTLHGVSKEITVRLERIGSAHAMKAYRTGFEGAFTIKRSDFDMKWRLDLLGDEIKVIVAIEGMRQ
ncbi:MAG: YceI family protein [Planctomycetota bacterium]|jgi:polyisoprenoid-binding protein YceI